jgi:hypothetical protein
MMRDHDFSYDHKLGGYPSKLDVGSKAQEHEYWMQRLRTLEIGFCLAIGCLAVCMFILAS